MATSGSTQLSEPRTLIAQLTGRDGDHPTATASLYLIRYSSAMSPDFGVVTPGVCLVAQGQKELLLGDEVYSNSPGNYLVASAEIPCPAQKLLNN